MSESQERRIRQYLKEAEKEWKGLSKLIEATKEDLALELEKQKKVVYQSQLNEWERKRTEIGKKIEHLEKDLQRISKQGGGSSDQNENLDGLASALVTYLKLVANSHSKIDLRWYAPSSPRELPIEDVMVQPQLSTPCPLPVVLSDRMASTTQGADRLPVSWEDAIACADHILLIGGAGTGKTTLARYICYSKATEFIQNQEPESHNRLLLVPIYLPLLELEMYLERHEKALDAIEGSPMIQFLQDYFRLLYKSDFSSFWKGLLENYDCLIVFDGLDEVSTAERQLRIIGLIDHLMTDYPRVHSVIILRPEVYKASGFNTRHRVSILLDLDPARQKELLAKLSARFRSDSDPTTYSNTAALEQFEALMHAPELEYRLRKPLFLVIAFLHYHYMFLDSELALLDSESPARVTSIQERLIKLMITDWDKIKARDTGGGLGSSQDQYSLEPVDFLSYLAWYLYQEANGQEAHEKSTSIDPLIKWLMETSRLSRLDARQIVLRIAQLACNRSGILAASLPPLAFKYAMDVDFLAARQIAENADFWEKLFPHLLDEQWRARVFKVSDLLSLRSASSADDFLSAILKRAHDESKEQQAKSVLLVALCLKRVVGIDVPIKNEVVSRIVEIISDRRQLIDLQTRIELGRVLGYLGDPRIGATVFVEKGPFLMGYDFFPQDRPAREVNLDYGYYVDKYPVTNLEFKKFIEAGGYTNPEYWVEEGWNWVQRTQRSQPKYWDDPEYNLPNYPVVGVTWYEAAAYAKWAGKRLLTEVEWEKAARGPSGREWPWGNEFRSDFTNAAEGDQQVGGPTPVGIFPAGASAHGAMDMSGNVSEWVEDWYDKYPGNPYEDPHFGKRFKTRRGGNWGWDRDYARCTCRVPGTLTADFAILGFRCVKV